MDHRSDFPGGSCKSFYSMGGISIIKWAVQRVITSEKFVSVTIRQLFPLCWPDLGFPLTTHSIVKFLQNPPISFQNLHKSLAASRRESLPLSSYDVLIELFPTLSFPHHGNSISSSEISPFFIA